RLPSADDGGGVRGPARRCRAALPARAAASRPRTSAHALALRGPAPVRGRPSPNEIFTSYPRLGENRARPGAELWEESGRLGGNPMSETQVHILEVTERDRIEHWRTEELERAGYSHRAAGRLAAPPHIDLHRAVSLLKRGCAPELALKILL